MMLVDRFRRWRARARRGRLIRRQLEAFAKIDPALYRDIGLYPQSFREEAERLADCQIDNRACAQGCTSRPGASCDTCTC